VQDVELVTRRTTAIPPLLPLDAGDGVGGNPVVARPLVGKGGAAQTRTPTLT